MTATVIHVDFRDPYADDVPSVAMARWLQRFDEAGLLPEKDSEGHRFPTTSIRACAWRNWVTEVGPASESGFSIWRITEAGLRALARAARAA